MENPVFYLNLSLNRIEPMYYKISIDSCLNPLVISNFLTASLWSPCNMICPSLIEPPVPNFVFNSLLIDFTFLLSAMPRMTVVSLLNFLISFKIIMFTSSRSN